MNVQQEEGAPRRAWLQVRVALDAPWLPPIEKQPLPVGGKELAEQGEKLALEER